MQHTCARRPLAFALASLTTLSTLLAVSPSPVGTRLFTAANVSAKCSACPT